MSLTFFHLLYLIIHHLLLIALLDYRNLKSGDDFWTILDFLFLLKKDNFKK
jgi:hypothetical protein